MTWFFVLLLMLLLALLLISSSNILGSKWQVFIAALNLSEAAEGLLLPCLREVASIVEFVRIVDGVFVFGQLANVKFHEPGDAGAEPLNE